MPAVKLGQPFAVIGDNPAYKTIRHPPLHPMCQCALEEVLDIDKQPEWAETLHDPVPEEEDYAEGEAPEGAPKPKPKPPKAPKKPGYTNPDAFDLPARGIGQPKTPAEPTSDYLPSDEEISKPSKKPKPPKAPPKPKKKPEVSEFPEPGENLKEVRPLGGSTGAKLVEDSKGRKFVYKKGANADHLREEGYADAMYRAMGVDVPPSVIYEKAAGPVKLSKFFEGQTLGKIKASGAAGFDAYDAAVAKLRENYAADALMGNWDVIGSGADNVLVTPDGKVLRIDNGGSLRFRAQGAKKSSTQWNGTVGELDSLRDPSINPDAAKVFKGLTDADIQAQVKALVKKRSKILAATPDELKEVIGQRLDYMEGWAKPKKPVKVGEWKAAPADKFKAVDDFDRWGKEHYEPWAKDLSRKQLIAVQNYTGAGYRKLNEYLRGVTTKEPSNIHILPDLDAALNKSPAPHDMIVYRGGGHDFLEKLGITNRNQIHPGMDLPDKGYTSTSPDRNKAWSGEKIEIRVAKGTPGAYVEVEHKPGQTVTTATGEYEFLLGREVDTFRVVEIHPDRIIVEALQSGKLTKGRKK